MVKNHETSYTPSVRCVEDCCADGKRNFDFVSSYYDVPSFRHEGIMVKNLDTPYIPDDRSTKWLKLKPDYVDSMLGHMDLIIIGTSQKIEFIDRSVEPI